VEQPAYVVVSVGDGLLVRARRDVPTDPKPAWRVRKQCGEPTPWLLEFDEVDDWLTTFAQLRGLHLTWSRATTTSAIAYSSVQQALVSALEPRAETGWPTSQRSTHH
jgi:hypothetical protein